MIVLFHFFRLFRGGGWRCGLRMNARAHAGQLVELVSSFLATSSSLHLQVKTDSQQGASAS